MLLTGILSVISFILLGLGTPAFLAFGLATSIAALWGLGLDPSLVAWKLWANIDSFTLLAAPLFILAGALMTEGGSSQALVGFINSLVRHIRGGLGIVVILACGFFAAMCGSVIATAAAIGMTMHKQMSEAGYPKKVSGAIIAAGATLGPIIPPSIWGIIYGTMSETNIAAIFMAGFIPGIIIIILFLPIVRQMAIAARVPSVPRAEWSERGTSFLKSIASLVTPLIILGGIYGGIFTPTEAGAVACVWALIIGIFLYKGLTKGSLYKSFIDSAKVTGNILLLVSTAVILGFVLSQIGVPGWVANVVTNLNLSAISFLLVFTLILVIMGMFMEALCILVITVPVMLPAALALGIDPVQLGMIIIVGLAVGQLSPPFGITVFTVAAFTEQPSEDIFRSVIPLMCAEIVVMILLSIFPQVSLFLPRLLLG